jgi:hypothetical protein
MPQVYYGVIARWLNSHLKHRRRLKGLEEKVDHVIERTVSVLTASRAKHKDISWDEFRAKNCCPICAHDRIKELERNQTS